MSDVALELSKTNIMCEFRIVGDEFEPETITEKLQLMPSKTWRKGDKIRQGERLRDYSSWGLCTEYEETYSVNDQINKILEIFKPKMGELLYLKESLKLDYKIEVVINIESNETPAIYLDKDIIQFCNSADVSLDFDLYIL